MRAPERWLSELAEDCAFLIGSGDYLKMQDRVREEAEKRHYQPMLVAQMVAREWDRLGIVRVGGRFPGLN